MINQSAEKRYAIRISLALAAVTLLAYSQVVSNGFVSFDDISYISSNDNVTGGITAESAAWAFRTTRAGNWHPLTWLSHMLDCQLFGIDPGWHHLVNVLFHIANALLLFGVLKKMTGSLWPSALTAALFALHPLCVESVAWAAQRKSVLSLFFALLTIAAYLRYTKRPGVMAYMPVLLCFALSLMAKPQVVTLPFVLLILDYWPLKRLKSSTPSGQILIADENPDSTNTAPATVPMGRLVYEKIPLFVLSAASCVITYLVQQATDAMQLMQTVPLTFRLLNVPVSYIGYITRTLFPRGLAVLYPHPGSDISVWRSLACSITLIVVTVAIISARHRRRYLFAGWLWYLGTLVPMVGLVQVGGQAMADRYSYLPLIGIFIIVAWGGREFFAAVGTRKGMAALLAGLLLFLSFLGTRKQTAYWHDDITLFARAVNVTEDNAMMHGNLGSALFKKGRVMEAASHFIEAIRIDPDSFIAHNNLGRAFAVLKKPDQAMLHYIRAIELNVDFSGAHYNMASLLEEQDRADEALEHLRHVIRIEPDHAGAHYKIAIAAANRGQTDDAIDHLRECVRIEPAWPSAHYNLGVILYQKRLIPQAIEQMTIAVQLDGNFVEARNSLAEILAQSDQPPTDQP
ncbi:MAG: tetratricopeptide repeat protein [Planctomycetes bacterium]|nr:tetratricopeptide repeat protein [Planctomycetota bacterium]